MGPIARRWWVVPIFAILGVAGGLGAISLVQPTFQSSSQVLLTPITSSGSTAALGATDYVEARALAYASVAASTDFRAQVLKALGAPADSEYPEYSVEVESNTTLISVNAVDISAEGSQLTARIIVNLIRQQVSSLDAKAVKTAQVRSDTVSQPLVPDEPAFPDRATFIALGFLVGTVLGLAFAYALGSLPVKARQQKSSSKDTRGASVSRRNPPPSIEVAKPESEL